MKGAWGATNSKRAGALADSLMPALSPGLDHLVQLLRTCLRWFEIILDLLFTSSRVFPSYTSSDWVKGLFWEELRTCVQVSCVLVLTGSYLDPVWPRGQTA